MPNASQGCSYMWSELSTWDQITQDGSWYQVWTASKWVKSKHHLIVSFLFYLRGWIRWWRARFQLPVQSHFCPSGCICLGWSLRNDTTPSPVWGTQVYSSQAGRRIMLTITIGINTLIWTYRGPEYSSIEVCGLFDADLQIRKLVSLPGLRSNERGWELPSHDGFGELCIHSSTCFDTHRRDGY